MPGFDLDRIKRMGRQFVARARISEDYRRVFNTPEGQRVLIDLARDNFLLSTTSMSGDSHMTERNEGRRAALLDLLAKLRWNAMDVIALAERTQEQDVIDRESAT